MTTLGPVEKVVELLEQSGYRRLPTPLAINRIKFDFPAVLDKQGISSDLILVVDTAMRDDQEIVVNVLGVARALDVSRASNSITTIIVGPRPSVRHLDELKSVCRVLPVGSISEESDGNNLSNWLAVLLPLAEFDTAQALGDPAIALDEKIEQLPAEVRKLTKAAKQGRKPVEVMMRDLVSDALKPIWEEQE
ncbi:hypothetical protein [Ruegeria sp. HKCCC2117]|uniref:hypothetical protein n=1 Tax=Ruegeria sp. HKCCC2117 TaxID=2682992 RepID=UPI001487F1E3|nr:hypothetical protein [Ruegeria sp. HKCCC2117]